MSFASVGSVASVSGLMDFGAYPGAGIGSAMQGFLIEKYSYNSMFILWLVSAFMGIIAVAGLLKHRSVE